MSESENLFTYRPPTDKTIILYKRLREASDELSHLGTGNASFHRVTEITRAMYDLILEIVPEGVNKERAKAATLLARMRANESIAASNGRMWNIALDCMSEARMWACAAIALSQPLPSSNTPPPPSGNTSKTGDDTGFLKIPDRYRGGGRETVDKMRDLCNQVGRDNGVSGDLLFHTACLTHVLKYRDRVKNPEDPEKAEWWEQMAASVYGERPDPRSERSDFEPYEWNPHK